MKPMSEKEFDKALDRLGFTNRGFCRWLGVDERSGRKWSAGDRPIAPPLAAFLRLALAKGLDADKLRKLLEQAGTAPPAARL